MINTRYKAAGVLTAVVLAASGGIGAQAQWGHSAVSGHSAAYRVLGSGEGPARPFTATVTDSGEGPATAQAAPTSGEGPA